VSSAVRLEIKQEKIYKDRVVYGRTKKEPQKKVKKSL
jgi:hypothetical protein